MDDCKRHKAVNEPVQKVPFMQLGKEKSRTLEARAGRYTLAMIYAYVMEQEVPTVYIPRLLNLFLKGRAGLRLL